MKGALERAEAEKTIVIRQRIFVRQHNRLSLDQNRDRPVFRTLFEKPGQTRFLQLKTGSASVSLGIEKTGLSRFWNFKC